MTKKVLQLIALALAGYVVYELVSRYMAERRLAEHRATARMPASLGHVGGAAMTGGTEGVSQQTLGPDGSSVTERVGRGVRRRQG